MDVGGSFALVLSEYTAYGLRATTGMNRNEVEGIRVGGANGSSDNYYSDYASFAEIANGWWDAGEDGRLTAVSGGTASTRLDPEMRNTYVHQSSAYVERELARDVGLPTGVVLNARRQPFGTVDISKPISAYSSPLLVIDPGPEAGLGSGSSFTPNSLVNSGGSQNRYTTWQGKVNGSVTLPAGFRLVPVLQHQSGTPFARTFVQALNFGNVVIEAERFVRRTPTITLFDLRTETSFLVSRTRVIGFFDIYNVFNTNAAQVLTTSSGGSWLRPTAVTGPRILRVGARLDW